MSEADGHAWFFAYGSLLWKPGFAHDRVLDATLSGYRRTLCVYSWYWRGTPDRPGLVLGLSPGGQCHGRLLGVEPDREGEVLAYLDERELVTDVYERRKMPVRCFDNRTREAWCYVAKPGHEQFAGDLTVEAMLPFVRQGNGAGGPNIDYVRATVEHLREMAIHEPHLEALIAALAEEPPEDRSRA